VLAPAARHRRVRGHDPGARLGRGAPGAAPQRRRGDRPSLRKRALRRDPRVLRGGRDLPARSLRRLHPPRVARERAGCPACAGVRMTLWSGRVETELDPAVWDFLKADDAELLPFDCQATLTHARRLHAAGLLDDGELGEVETTLSEILVEDLDESDEDVHS